MWLLSDPLAIKKALFQSSGSCAYTRLVRATITHVKNYWASSRSAINIFNRGNNEKNSDP